jgi:hypothetical protein
MSKEKKKNVRVKLKCISCRVQYGLGGYKNIKVSKSKLCIERSEEEGRSMAQGAWRREHGTGSMAQGAWNREQGAGSKEQGAGNLVQGAGSR